MRQYRRGQGSITKVTTRRKDGSTYHAGWRGRYYTADGARVSRSFGPREKGAAREWLIAELGKPNIPGVGSRSFLDLVTDWHATWRRYSPSTVARYRDVLRVDLGITIDDDGRAHSLPAAKRVRPYAGTFANRRAIDIGHGDIQRFVDRVADSGQLSQGSVKKVLTVLGAIFTTAVKNETVPSNPCRDIDIGKPKPYDPRDEQNHRLTPDEVNLLAEAMTSERDRLVVYVAAYTGARAGEIWALRTRDVDLLHNRLHVTRAVKDANGVLSIGGTKMGRTPIITLDPELAEMLRDYLASPRPGGSGPDALLFPSRTGQLMRHNAWMARRYRRTVRKALPHKPGFRFHDLRHTHASMLTDQGVTLQLIAQRLGHSSIRTTERYSHPDPALHDEIAATLGAVHSAAREVTRLPTAGEAS